MKTKVIPISANFEFPKSNGRIDICSTIQTKEAAEAWGQERGYQVVWWWKSAHRAYAMKDKIKMVKGSVFVPGYPVCQGCENLTVGIGWACSYKPDTLECEYPDAHGGIAS